MGSQVRPAGVGFCTYVVSAPFVAMGAIFSFFFPWEDTGPDTREDAKKEQSDVKEVANDETQDTKKKTPEVTSETKVTVPQITEEALEEADYEVVDTHNDPSSTLSAFGEESTLSASQESTLSAGSPRTPQNSFASLPSNQQLDDGFEVINQRTEDDLTSLLNVYKVATNDIVESDAIAKEEEEEEEGSPIANLKSGVEALISDLSASSGPEKDEESDSKSTTTTTSVVKDETSTSTTVVREVQTTGEVQDVGEETNREETVDP